MLNEDRLTHDSGSPVPALLVLLAFGILLVLVAVFRPLDQDEGIYQYAAYLIADGKLPYRDFVFPQLPYLSYPYALLPPTLLSARLVSIAFGLALGCSLMLALRSHPKERLWVLIFLATNGAILAWVPVAKHYALTMSLSYLAFWLVLSPSYKKTAISGALLGIVCGTRLLYFPFPFVFGLFLGFPKSGRWQRLSAFALGLALTLLPVLGLALVAPQEFWFGIIGVHEIRSAHGAIGFGLQKLWIVFEIVTNPQWLLVLILVSIGLVLRRDRNAILALGLAASLTATSLLPTPVYRQYFVCILPFLFYLTVPAFEMLRRRYSALLLVVVLYVSTGLVSYREEIGQGLARYLRELSTIESVVELIRDHTEPGETILSLYPGFAVWSETYVPDGLANNFAFGHGQRLSAAERTRLKIPSYDEFEQWIVDRRFSLAIIGWTAITPAYRQRFVLLLEDNGYRRISAVDSWPVYLRESSR